MNKISYLKSFTLLAFATVFFIACDDDFNVLGADIIGIDNFGFGKLQPYEIRTSNVNLGAVESSDLPINPLGVYDNPVFGLTEANFVTQLELDADTEGVSSINPTIDLTKNPEVISVVLRVPYFVKSSRDTSGKYVLDSIYGSPDYNYSPMKLSVYESGYFMRDVDPADQSAQSYYTDQASLFESYLIGERLNNDNSDGNVQNDNFKFSREETTTTKYTTDDVGTPTAATPAMKLQLKKEFFNQKILRAPAGKLLNNGVFKDYFRGLYFKVEKNGANPGNLGMLNFRGGIITINYKEDGTSGKVYKRIILNMKGKCASLVNQGPIVDPAAERLYLKGNANNSMAVIDLFKKDVNPADDELTKLRSHKNDWLINDASLTFTIDTDKMNLPGTYQPLRVYLYDLNNKRQLIDYVLDGSSGASTTKYNKRDFGGIIRKDVNGRGVTYKIRITNHINNLMKHSDSTNVRLGLVVTEDINNVSNKKIKNPALGGALKVIPTMSIVHPLGTVLYGSDATDDVSKRPKFEIYYTDTKPKQN